MFVELLESIDSNSKKPEKRKRIFESDDPTEILRKNGFKIKKSMPYKNGLEIEFFENAENLNFKCLKDFKHKIKDGKLIVYF